ncbi:2-phosphosulfolactate phosphatase [soil metagenome]
MLRVDLDLLPAFGDRGVGHDVAIVIDVLRMTTTATAMLAHGYRRIDVVAEVDDARALATRTGALLFGERQGVAPAGFDGGNSPLEHQGPRVEDRAAVLCTSNGSKAVEAARARHVLLGAIVNARAVARRAVALADDGVHIVCAGTDGAPSLDDVVAAGYVLGALTATGAEVDLSDTCVVAMDVAAAAPDPVTGLHRARHARTLVDLGFEADVAFAGDLDRFALVPERRGRSGTTFGRADIDPDEPDLV